MPTPIPIVVGFTAFVLLVIVEGDAVADDVGVELEVADGVLVLDPVTEEDGVLVDVDVNEDDGVETLEEVAENDGVGVEVPASEALCETERLAVGVLEILEGGTPDAVAEGDADAGANVALLVTLTAAAVALGVLVSVRVVF
jgi:hypothetical protein